MIRPSAADARFRSCRGSNRAAYTLMEMLISSVLIAALMSVIWGMLSMYNSYLTAGRQRTLERQLIRSVFTSFESDIRQVAIADTNPKIRLMTESLESIPESGSEGRLMESAMGTEPGEELSEQSSDTLEAQQFEILRPSPNLRLVGLRGSESTMRLNFVKDIRPANQAADVVQPELETDEENMPGTGVDGSSSSTPVIPEFRTVLWYFRSLQSLSTGTGAATQSEIPPETATITESGGDVTELPGSASLPGSMIASISEPGLYRIETSSQRYQLSQQLNSDTDAGTAELQQTDLSVNPLELLLRVPEGAQRGSQSQADDQFSDLSVLDEPIRVDAVPEVVRCRIRYYSGSNWLSDWNSEAQRALPLAIRIELMFVPSSELTTIRELLGQDTGPSTDATMAASELPTIRLQRIERTIVLQPIQHSFPMFEETDSSGTAEVSTGFTSEGEL